LFNRNNGLAIPLIALQYHDVRITIDFRPLSQCVNTTSTAPVLSMTGAQLIIDYVYLDSEERKRFAQASHEYLIEQLQFTGSENMGSTSNKYRLNFNHPCKYLIWASHLNNYNSSNKFIAYTASSNKSDWEKARDKFAKAVWFVTRAGFQKIVVNGENMYQITTISNSGSIEVISPLPDSNTSATISSGVTAQMIFNNVNQSISGSSVLNTPITAQEVLEQIVILENNLTIDNMSYSTSVLSASGSILWGTSGTPADGAHLSDVATFFNDISVSVNDYFNYGNYIDGTDNPVYNAKLQLNGSDRFQDRDGNYLTMSNLINISVTLLLMVLMFILLH
jgi:hypothetical protein